MAEATISEKQKTVSITIMVPAYNEEQHLEETIHKVQDVAGGLFRDYEILIMDDGSTDRTAAIADELSRHDPAITVVHNNGNKGLGYCYKLAVSLARKDYFSWFPGDNDFSEGAMREFLRHTGEADIIMHYTANMQARPLYRQLLSHMFVGVLNTLFGLRLKYYTGITIYRTRMLQGVKMDTASHALQPEILVRLIKKGATYQEVPLNMAGRDSTKIFRPKNIYGMVSAVIRLFIEMHSPGAS